MISHDRSCLPLDKPRKLTERSPLAAGQLDLELNEPCAVQHPSSSSRAFPPSPSFRRESFRRPWQFADRRPKSQGGRHGFIGNNSRGSMRRDISSAVIVIEPRLDVTMGYVGSSAMIVKGPTLRRCIISSDVAMEAETWACADAHSLIVSPSMRRRSRPRWRLHCSSAETRRDDPHPPSDALH